MGVTFLNPYRFGGEGGGGPGPGAPATDYFIANGSNYPQFGSVSYPCAFYDSTGQTTWFCWESWNGSARVAQVTTYNHNTGKWSAVYDVGIIPLTNDSHGVPAICMDHEGYVHCFYGPHDGNMLHSSTIAARDPSSWRLQAILSGSFTYPHPVLVGSTLYLFMRELQTTPRVGVRYKTTALSGGVPTWGTKQNIVNLNNSDGARFYSAAHIVSSTDIHFVAMWSNSAHTVSRHVYHFVYDTVDDSIHNASGGTDVVVGSQPIDLTTANASFRVVDFGATDQGDIPAFCIDSSGNLHIVYVRGTSDPGTLYHTIFSGGSWSAPASIGTIDGGPIGNFTESITLVALSGGVVHLYYPNNKASFTYGGDCKRRIWNGNSWGSETTILAAGAKPLHRMSTVRSGHANARVVFSETSQNELDASAGGLKVYCYGDAGFLTRQPQAPTDITLSSTKVKAGVSTGTVIGQLHAVDTDYQDSFTWSINSDPDGKFTITGNELKTNATISYPNSHNVTIAAEDSFGNVKTKAFTITVVQTQAELNDTFYSSAALVLDGERPGSGTDASISNVVLLIDAT